MNLRDELLAEHSKNQTMRIVDYIGGDGKKFDELMQLFLFGEYRVQQRSAWVVSYSIERDPKLIEPYFPKIIKRLTDPTAHNAVARNIVRLLQFVEIPKKFEGTIYSICIDLLDDPRQSIAVRVFSMSVAARIARNEPDLLNEVRFVAKNHLQHASAGFKARARSIFGSEIFNH